MARRTGIGVFYDLEDIPQSKRVYNRDGSRVATWWISREKMDAYDHDTVFEIAVWARAGRMLEHYTRLEKIDLRRPDKRHGRRVRGVRFGDNGTDLWISYDEGEDECIRSAPNEAPDAECTSTDEPHSEPAPSATADAGASVEPEAAESEGPVENEEQSRTMTDEVIDGPQIAFRKPAKLTLREQSDAQMMIYRMNHPDFRMELNVMAGEIVTLITRATPTQIKYYPPLEGAPRTDLEARNDELAALCLGAVEADNRREGPATVLNDVANFTAAGLLYRERAFLSEALGVVSGVAIVFDARSHGALIGYAANQAHRDAVDEWKQSVLDSLRLG